MSNTAPSRADPLVCTHKNPYNLWAQPVPWFNIKKSPYQYRKSHWGNKTVVRSSYLHSGISYTGKMASLYWFGPLIQNLKPGQNCKHCHFVLASICNNSSFGSLFSKGHGNRPEQYLIGKLRAYLNGIMQETHNPSALAIELRLSCINPLTCSSSSRQSRAFSQRQYVLFTFHSIIVGELVGNTNSITLFY